MLQRTSGCSKLSEIAITFSEAGVPGPRAALFLTFRGTSLAFPAAAAPAHVPAGGTRAPAFLLIRPQQLLLSPRLLTTAIVTGAGGSLLAVWVRVSLMTGDAEHLFARPHVVFGKTSIPISGSFRSWMTGVFGIEPYEFRGSPDTNPSSDGRVAGAAAPSRAAAPSCRRPSAEKRWSSCRVRRRFALASF